MLSPFFSVIVPVRGRSHALRECLAALARQVDAPDFEVVVVDDGSCPPLDELPALPFPAKLVRQIPLGIAAARNRGVDCALGAILLFLDSDCIPEPGALDALAQDVRQHRGDVAFQLHLTSEVSSCVRCVEGLRLKATLAGAKTTDGHVHYLNTSGFALRRSWLEGCAPFETCYLRGEDTALLARLLSARRLPRYVPQARIRHLPELSLWRYLGKHFTIGYRTGPARVALARADVHGLLDREGRARVFAGMLRDAARRGLGPGPLLLAAACYAAERVGRGAHIIGGVRRARQPLLSTSVDPVRERDLVARILRAAEERRPLLLTYLTAWSLVQAHRDPVMAAQLERFDILYADGIGAVLALLVTRGQRIHKVTAGDFFMELLSEASRRSIGVAFVGARERSMNRFLARVRRHVPDLDIVLHSNGYLALDEEADLVERLRASEPALIVLGLGQPHQELLALRISRVLPTSVVWCVGGVFDTLSGETPTPPRLSRVLGLDWAHRLATRPRRMWFRYLFGVPVLAALVAGDLGRRALGYADPAHSEASERK